MLTHRPASEDPPEAHGHDGHDAHAATAHDDHGHGHDDHHAVETSPHDDRRIRFCEYVTTGFLALSCLLSWIAFFSVGYGGNVASVPVLDWIHVGNLDANWALRIDTLTAVMLVV